MFKSVDRAARTEADDPYCLPTDQLTAVLATAPFHRFGVVGDSLSLGTSAPTPGYRDLGWSDRVAQVLAAAHPGSAYLNTAQVGVTTDRVLEEQVAAMREFGPDLLHLLCGANDILRRTVDFTAVERDQRRLWEVAAGTGALLQTFTLGRAFVVPALEDWHERITRMNDLTRAVAAEHRAVLVDMWDHPVNDRVDLVGPDRIHFSTSGQAVMATEVVRALAAARVR